MNKSLLQRLLEYYNISYEQYTELTSPKTLDNFALGHKFDDIEKAVKLVKDVKNSGGRIIVYGDYDCDGIMGTSILVKMFQLDDYVIDYYIPNRYLDGYGINMAHAEEYVGKYDLVITVDNGISAFEPIEYLHNHGVKVLVLDHHQAQETLPLADAICHPTVTHFGETASSGAFTAFIYSISYLGYIDKYLATLAGISLISDMMPLLDYNRSLLRAIFASYKDGEYLPISLLADHEQIDEVTIGMKIAPRINSIGRLCDDLSIGKIVEFFTSDDEDFILSYYSHILEMNEARKELSKPEQYDLRVDPEDKAIVIAGDFKEGIIGLIANSLMNKYHKPAIVLTKAEDGSYKGSARAPEGFNVVEAFTNSSDLLLAYGGHAGAGGCSVSEVNLEEFTRRFKEEAELHPIVKVEHPYIDIGMNELSFENYYLIQSFSPFGESWPAPILRIRRIKVSSLMYSRDGKHVITSLGQNLKLVYFSFPRDELLNCNYVDFYGSLNIKSYNGKKYLEFSCRDFDNSDN